ncbi:protein CANDIDATE G-PROTEIN COUPLED RECEPTOR 2-like [Rutidosis leptorrhynchoides]|uniref:protein CANDIDATE G-PROTEIN COUPLED RECEPTOR 2-like n=1 Tax=Rutidosis leptorrhynchoides TaxID=125765 RepID=UPI003A99C436
MINDTIGSIPSITDIDHDDHHATSASLSSSPLSQTNCHGLWYTIILSIPAVLFVLYLGFHLKKNIKKLRNRRSHVMITYYVLLWFSATLNLAWCSLQVWQCVPGKELSWNLLSLLTSLGTLCLEISLVAFLLQESYASGLETLAHTFIVSGVIVGADILLKAICVFGFHVPLFIDGETTHRGKWGLWALDELLLTCTYGYILFVHYSKWRDKLPPRPSFYNYVVVMFVVTGIALFGCGFASLGVGFGLWLYNFMVICYHTLYLPFVYVTFLADFFQEEDLLLDNAYYSEMKDAGFFDSDLE